MFRLTHVIMLMTNAVLVGGALIFVLAMGWFHWIPVTIVIVAGFALSWPVARLVGRAIKADDPLWDERRDRPERHPVMPPDATPVPPAHQLPQ